MLIRGRYGRQGTRWPRLGVPFRMAAVMTLVSLAVLGPVGMPNARAAEDDLRLEAGAVYTVDPGAGVIRVRIDVRATNRKPDLEERTPTGTTTTRYFIDRLILYLPREATSVKAASGGLDLTTSIGDRADYRKLTIRIPRLYFEASRSVRVGFELPGGKPRSESDIRVGSAFTTFTAWAWGDPGLGAVEIVLPRGYVDSGYGDSVTTTTDDEGRLTLSSGPIREPDTWYRVISADRPSRLTDLRLGSSSGSIVIRAWPEDEEWRDEVAVVVGNGVPALEEAIGLDWPVDGALEVTEVHSPLLEGYAGFYDPDLNQIRMSEELDAQTILHEASHAWFNLDLIAERWVNEGLAEVYAERARAELGGIEGTDPVTTTPGAEGAFPLVDWPPPGRVDDQTWVMENYGYAASYTVMDRIVRAIGDEGMRRVFEAARADTIAYIGDGPAEPSVARSDWRHFLDLLEEVGGGVDLDDLFATWIVGPAERATLQTRAAVRERYAALESAGAEWAVPLGIRSLMDDWRFSLARVSLANAEAVVVRRDEVAALERDLGLVMPRDLEAAYEVALTVDDLAVIDTTLSERQDAAAAVLVAREGLAGDRSPLVALGLIGEEPEVGYLAAREALAAGDTLVASAAADATMALLAGAEEVGRTRLVIVAVTAAGIVVTVGLAVLVVRRRRRSNLAEAAVGSRRYATLAAPTFPGGDAEPSDAAGGPESESEPGVQTD
ncbi:MAG: hypothetical protein OEV61_01040 [Chloroflexota bacterium]|nr:hypothetical protein [Chloroflexota bacterium]